MWDTQVLYVAATLGIPDYIATHGPLGAERLAALTGTHARSLYRVLWAVLTLGMVDETERHDFRLTP